MYQNLNLLNTRYLYRTWTVPTCTYLLFPYSASLCSSDLYFKWSLLDNALGLQWFPGAGKASSTRHVLAGDAVRIVAPCCFPWHR